MKSTSLLFVVGIMAHCALGYSQITSTSKVLTTKNSGTDSIEYVTVGSIMPYSVTPYNWGTLSSYMNPSIFKWWLNGNATGYNLLKSDGVTPLATLPPPNNVYYPDTGISIQWVKAGKYTIRVSEKSMPKVALVACDQSSNIQTLDVVVANRPTIAWDGPILKGGCGTDGSVQEVPVIISGSKQVTVTFTVVFTPQTGTPDTLTDQKAIFTIAKNDTSSHDTIKLDVPKGNFGKYEITVTGITDKTSAKCGIASQAGDYPSDKYTLLVFPVMETSPIKFVKEVE